MNCASADLGNGYETEQYVYIRDTCDGKGRNSALSFFWRWKVEDGLKVNWLVIEETVKFENRKAVTRFPKTCRTAEWLGVDVVQLLGGAVTKAITENTCGCVPQSHQRRGKLEEVSWKRLRMRRM
jgi:hypothetical protein